MTETPAGRAAPKSALLLCDCEGTARIDGEAIAPGCAVHTNLCGRQASIVEAALRADAPVTIACAQEATRFEEQSQDLAEALAAEGAAPAPLAFVDLRDRAGWSDEAANAAPKMAALLAEAALSAPPTPQTLVRSEGLCLIYGDGETALQAAQRLSETLSVTCLLRSSGDAAAPPRAAFPIVSGRIRNASGALGGFELAIDAFAEREPGGRGGLRFAAPRDGARTRCDIILDLSGDSTLFPAPDKRAGYVRADPRDPIAVERALFDASQLIGEFDKPLYIRFEESLCAHSRARQPGCDRCLSLCPTVAITPNGDHVSIDPMICAGCGACASVCPTGAATYADPPFEHLLRRLRTLSEAYRGHPAAAGAPPPVLLAHDAEHGAEMIALAARCGRGLPAHVLPLELEELGQFGHAAMLSALSMGFAGAVLLLGPKAEREAAQGEIALADALASGAGAATAEGAARLRLLESRDPDEMTAALYGFRPEPHDAAPALPLGAPREATRVALKGLAAAAPPAEPISLAGLATPTPAPYGAVTLDQEACTLCLACVSLCPTGALSDDPDRPALRFQEDACVQCGICASACPETALTLTPRYDLSDAALSVATLKSEEPFACIECGKEFGVKSAIERISEKLAGSNWMYTDSDNVRLIQMCDDCRVGAQYHSESSPFQMGTPRRTRTTEDYLREREESGGEGEA
ncbi:MAG: 4Fe-4S binding protein [Pseudomonadota bacterium]